MEALILSCGTGGGHNAAGRAMLEALERRGHRAAMFNPYTLKSETAALRIDNAYIRVAQRAPRAFGAIYGLGNLWPACQATRRSTTPTASWWTGWKNFCRKITSTWC